MKIERVWNTSRGTEVGARIGRASNSWTRFRGLLGRGQLREGEGLHIIPCSSVHMFFMYFALDLIYLDREQCVVKVVSGLGPWRISAARGAKSVLELPIGTIERSQTAVGDHLAAE